MSIFEKNIYSYSIENSIENRCKKNKGCFEVTFNGKNDTDIKEDSCIKKLYIYNKILKKYKKTELEINCAPKVGEQLIQKKQKELYLIIEDTSNIINSSKSIDYKSKYYYMDKLYDIAMAGLSIKTNEVYPELSIEMVNKLKEEICLRESSTIKNKYLKILGMIGIIHSIVIYLVFYYFKKYNIDLFQYFYTYMGSIVGSWVSFNARKLNLSFDELTLIEKDGLNPSLRIMHNGLCSIIIMLFIKTQILSISIASFNTNSINYSSEMQMILGIIVGLVEYPISQKIFNKANSIVNEL